MIYLDHAATSFPKPAPVLAAMDAWFRDVGVSAARGSGDRCAVAAREVDAARGAIAALVGMPRERVAFVSGATEGLNLALRALLRPGDRVLTTAFEHSSVVRPLRALQDERALRVEVLPPDADGGLGVASIARALRDLRPALFVATHASNVTGQLFDAAGFVAAAHAVGARVLLDASQTAGHVELAVGADVVVASGHKALQGPPGIGFVASTLPLLPQKQGGTGSSTALAEHPTTWPEAFEAGTPNTPAIFALAAALRGHAAAQRAAALAHGLARLDELAAPLRRLRGVRVLSPAAGPRVPVLAFVHAGFDPAEIGALLAGHDVHVRTGHQCAPWLHRYLGTEVAGVVRLSTGAATTAADTATAGALLASLGDAAPSSAR